MSSAKKGNENEPLVKSNDTRASLNEFVDEATGNSELKASIDSYGQRRGSRYSYIAGEHGLTTFQGMLAILSTCVGGGIVGLPLAMYNLGIPIAIFLQILAMIATHWSAKMYLFAKDRVPDSPDSLYEVGFLTMGRFAIYFIASIFIINAFGLVIIYFMVFGDTFGQFIAGFYPGTSLDSDWYTSRWFYSLPLAVVLIPICLKKELAELAWVSYFLFFSIAVFTIVNLY